MAILELPSEDQPLDASAPRPQTTDTVFMIRPATTFRCNEETMGDNAFQHEIVPEGVDFSSPEAIAGFQTEFHARVLREFDAFVETLRSNGVNVVVVQDTEIPDTPDAVFPNNWVSLHHGGIQVRYPMKAPNRRLERELAPDVFGALTHAGHDYPTEVDLTSNELSDFPQALEGTGSMVLDRKNRIAYAAFSERTTPAPLGDFCKALDYKRITFDTIPIEGSPVYHTNVVMSVGTKVAVLCMEAISDPESRQEVCDALEQTGHQILEISLEQLTYFAGNMLEVQNSNGQSIWVMSQQAHDALNPDQLAVFTDSGSQILAVDIQTIETAGGGSARCMMAEVF